MKSSIDELQAFVSIVDRGSINAAAEQLRQTTSGVSRALRRLESKLGTTLLERTTRKIKLTQEGQAFLGKVRKILSDLDAAEDEVNAFEYGGCGVIRVDSATPFILHVIAPFIKEFLQLYPTIQIVLNTNDRVIDLLEQKTDVAFRFGQLSDSSLHARLMCKSRLYIVASPAYLQQKGYPEHVRDLLPHDLIGFSQVLSLNQWPLLLDGKRLTIQPRISASNGETVRQLALLGNGIACLSQFLVSSDLKAGRLVALFEQENLMIEQNIHAVYYQQAHLPKRVRLFIDFLAEKLKSHL